MEKIAVISDVHGVFMALEAVINDAKKRGIEGFIFAGDYTEGGPSPNECLDVVRSLTTDGVVIAGNKETFILDYLEKEKNGVAPNLNTALYVPTLWVMEQLSQNNLDYIKTLPITLNTNILGHDIQVAHGSPESVNEFLTEEVVQNRSEEFINKYKSDIFLFGHSHIAYQFDSNNAKFINPGSIGAPRFTNFTFPYSIIEFNNGEVKAYPVNVPYNPNDINSYFKSYIQDVGFAGEMLRDQISTGKEAVNIYLTIVKSYANSLGFEGNIYPPEITNYAVSLYKSVIEGKISLEEAIEHFSGIKR